MKKDIICILKYTVNNIILFTVMILFMFIASFVLISIIHFFSVVGIDEIILYINKSVMDIILIIFVIILASVLNAIIMLWEDKNEKNKTKIVKIKKKPINISYDDSEEEFDDIILRIPKKVVGKRKIKIIKREDK